MSNTKPTIEEFRADLRGLIVDGYEDNPVIQALADETVANFDALIEQARAEGQAPEDNASNPHGVKVGQTWRSNDKRDSRTGRVVSIDDTHARVDWGVNVTRVKLTRFKPTSTGYLLIQDVKG